MRWLIVGLLGLVLLGGLLMFIRGRGRSRPKADDALVTDLLGPPDLPAVPARQARRKATPPRAPQARQKATPPLTPQARREAAPPLSPQARRKATPPRAPKARREAAPPPASPERDATPMPAPQAREDNEPSPAPSALPDGQDDWLEAQLAWIAAWSQRMNQRITSSAEAEPDSKE